MKTLFFVILTLLIVFLISIVVMAQPDLPGGPGGPDQAPIDGGLSLLALAGGGYAIKKLRDRRINEDSDL